ncbi:MAG: ORF6N domain-containing protein [Verrucomicrobia bacterium]|nr:ORF6N domain-containing protein [Verrucomicrobiota bacterium]
MKKPIETLILTIRDQTVLLDADLAEIYGVPTKVFNQAVKRNAKRFPEDFRFQLTAVEWENLKSQIVTSSLEIEKPKVLRSQFATSSSESSKDQQVTPNRSQNATGSHGGRRTLPYAFTEHGAIMAATVLNSPEAVTMSVYVVRAFVQMREQIAANREILRRLAEIDQSLLKHDKALQVIWTQLQPLLAPPPAPKKPRIGFHNE